MRNAILLFVFFILIKLAYSQEPVSTNFKNYLYVDAAFPLGAMTGFNYERIITPKKGGTFSVSGGAGYGLYFIYMSGLYAKLNGNAIFSREAHHLELGAGVYLLSDYGFFKNSLILPDVHAGYKFHKPGSRFLLKAGVGFPKIVSVGVGMAF
jgi:hypothetical protein